MPQSGKGRNGPPGRRVGPRALPEGWGLGTRMGRAVSHAEGSKVPIIGIPLHPGPEKALPAEAGERILRIVRLANAALPLLVLAACGGDPGASRDPLPGGPAESRWITIEGVQFPAVFAEAPPEIVEAYVFAARHPEVLEHMPCYCGCERESPPHGSNYDCFVDAIDRTGSVPRVDPDPMGFT